MNFKETEQLLTTVTKYLSSDKIRIQTDTCKDYLGKSYTADYVQITNDPNNHIGIEVTENEIIIFFFTDHAHFEDYTSPIKEGETNYIQRAAEFLDKLFTLPIERNYTIKGNRIIRDESFFIIGNKKVSCAGITLSFAGFRNMFKKKKRVCEKFLFNKETACFICVD